MQRRGRTGAGKEGKRIIGRPRNGVATSLSFGRGTGAECRDVQ